MSNDRSKFPAKRPEVEKFLAKVKASPPVTTTGHNRLIFGLDATLSRQPLWDHASQLHAEMFMASAKEGELQIQLAYFRGFAEFRHSSWVQNPKSLVELMTAIRCRAGHTQIERLLAHVITETGRNKISAAIFVGDAMEEDEDSLYKLAGQLGLLRTPLFFFQEGYQPGVEQVFKNITRLSGGAYCHFDEASVDQLRILLGAVAKYAKGGYRALKQYAEQRSGAKHGRKALELIRQLPAPGDRT